MESHDEKCLESLYQLELLRIRDRHSHALHAALSCLQHFEAQPIFFNDLALFRNSACEFAHQAGDRGRISPLRTHTHSSSKSSHAHVARTKDQALAFPPAFRTSFSSLILPTNPS